MCPASFFNSLSKDTHKRDLCVSFTLAVSHPFFHHFPFDHATISLGGRTVGSGRVATIIE